MKVNRAGGLKCKRRRLLPGRGEKGFMLIEVLVSIAILGVVSVGFLSAMVAAYHGVIVSHEHTMAESLTRTAFEQMRSAPFPYGTSADNYTTTTPNGNFDVVVHGEFVGDNYTLSSTSTNVQLITVTIQRHADGSTVLETQTTKVQ